MDPGRKPGPLRKLEQAIRCPTLFPRAFIDSPRLAAYPGRTIMTNCRAIVAACTILHSSAACDLSVGPTPGMVETIGVVFENSIVVPDTVMRGSSFLVQFASGGDFCFKWGGHEVLQSATSIVIEPRMFINLKDSLCEIGNGFTHRVTAVFDQPGLATVIIRSLSNWPGAPPVDTLSFERTVVVR